MFSDFLSEKGMPVIFEAAQPHGYVNDKGTERPVKREDLYNVLNALANAAGNGHVYGIGVPEVHDGATQDAMPPLQYASWLKERIPTDIVLYRAPPYFPKEWCEQEGYAETVRANGISNLIIAGARDSTTQYLGYPPLDFIARIKPMFGDKLFIGGITIPTRKNEAERLVKKTAAGMRYFRSQQIFDAEPAKRVLKDYWLQCQEQGLEPQIVFLSFVPVLNEHTIGKLRDLGVAIPEDVERTIYAGGDRKAMRRASIRIAKQILQEILDYTDRRVAVPLGLDIESFFAGPVSVELAAELMDELEGVAKYYRNPAIFKGSQ